MGNYDHILGKNADVYYKTLITELAKANEMAERNRLKRIELAIKVVDLPKDKKDIIEAHLGEELDLSDLAAE